MLCLWLNFSWRLLSAERGNLHADNAFLIWLFSSCSEDWWVQMALALCVKVLNTLFLADMEWLLSQWRYWLVCVGFLYDAVVRVLSRPGETKVSKNGSEQSWLGSSVVNRMCGSCELMCWRSCCVCSACWMTKVSYTYLSHRHGGKVQSYWP